MSAGGPAGVVLMVPRLCAEIGDMLTFAANLIETATIPCRLANGRKSTGPAKSVYEFATVSALSHRGTH